MWAAQSGMTGRYATLARLEGRNLTADSADRSFEQRPPGGECTHGSRLHLALLSRRSICEPVVLPDGIALPLRTASRYVNRALANDVLDHLRHPGVLPRFSEAVQLLSRLRADTPFGRTTTGDAR